MCLGRQSLWKLHTLQWFHNYRQTSWNRRQMCCFKSDPPLMATRVTHRALWAPIVYEVHLTQTDRKTTKRFTCIIPRETQETPYCRYGNIKAHLFTLIYHANAQSHRRAELAMCMWTKDQQRYSAENTLDDGNDKSEANTQAWECMGTSIISCSTFLIPF